MEKVLLSNSKIGRLLEGNWMLYLIVLLILGAETTAISFLKEYSLTHNTLNLLEGFGFYLLVNIFLALSFRYEGMGIVNILWSAFSVLLVVATGVFLFGERISVMETAGITLVIAGVAVLESRKASQQTTGGQCLHLEADDIPSYRK